MRKKIYSNAAERQKAYRQRKQGVMIRVSQDAAERIRLLAQCNEMQESAVIEYLARKSPLVILNHPIESTL